MRLTRITVLLALCLMLVSCGGGHFDTINGNWTATLSGTATQSGAAEVLKFTVTLNQTSPPGVDATNFTLSTPTSCLSDPSTVSSTFSNGAFTMDIVGFPGVFQNVLKLQGNVNGSALTGSWTFTGGPSESGCDGSGTFKLTKG
jgi:hypothetical protein